MKGERALRNWRYILILLVVAVPMIVLAQPRSGGVRKRTPKQVETEGRIARRMQDLNERAHDRLTSGMSMSPDQYEDTIRALFRADRWHDAEPFLVAAEREWGGRSNICCLIGTYWYHEGDLEQARRYLLLALVDDESNTEALEILVKLEEREGNFATAIVHVNDLLSFSPYNIRLWRKKIELFRELDNDPEADRLLERLAIIYPNDEQVQADLVYRKELEYIRLSKQGNEHESQKALQELIVREPTRVEYYTALSGSLLKEGKLQEAEEVCAKGVLHSHGNRTLIRRRVGILIEGARYQEAEQYLDDCIRKYGSTGLTDLRDYLKQEAAYAADAADAYTRYRRLYATTNSDESLDWLVSNSMQRAWWDEAEYWLGEKEKKINAQRAQTASELEEEELDKEYRGWLAKKYLVEKRLGNERAAARILEDMYLADTQDEEIREMLAEKRLREAMELMDQELWQEALAPLHQADTLTMDSDFHSLVARRIRTCEALLPDTTVKDSLDWAQRSAVYEKEKMLDSAYVCLMRYRPTLDEFHEIQRHRYTLLSKLQKNTLTFEYQYARRASKDVWTHNAHVTYTRKFDRDAFDAVLGYAGRETTAWTEQISETKDTTYVSGGGSGFEVGGAYYHYFEWGEVSASGSWASLFFPKATAKISASENLPLNWTLTERLQWRYIVDETKYHVFSLGASAGWSSENGFVLTPGVDAFLMQGKLYWNGGFKMNYFPLDGDRSTVYASFSAGNAPDLSLLDSNVPVAFNTLNTSLSAGGFYLSNGHFGRSGAVDWYVMGGQDGALLNYIYLHAGMSIFF